MAWAPRFRCPHCRQKTLSAWAKLKTSGWSPAVCPQCGGKSVPAWLGALPAMISSPLAFIAPFVIARTAGPTGIWILFGIGLVLALVVPMAVYLLVTPLLRQGSTAARWDHLTWVAAVATAVVWLLVRTPDPSLPPSEPGDVFRELSLFRMEQGERRSNRVYASQSMRYENPEEQAAFKAALTKAGIPFTVEMRDGREYLEWKGDQFDAVAKIQQALRAERPGCPKGSTKAC